MIQFVTSNEGKVREAREYLPETVRQVNYDYTEIQSDDLETIVERGALEAYREIEGDEPVLVDDTGLFVEALDGFPGPYSAYVDDTLGIERVQRLVEQEENHRAAFRTVLGYYDGETVKTFEGSLRGRVVPPRGDSGFGYDPIFEHDGATLAERSTAEKNAISHRARALATFADWLADQE